MSGQASAIIAPRSPPSMPHSAPLSVVALRPALTAPARGAWLRAGRDGETPPSRTKKQTCSYGSAILQNLTHTTYRASQVPIDSPHSRCSDPQWVFLSRRFRPALCILSCPPSPTSKAPDGANPYAANAATAAGSR